MKPFRLLALVLFLNISLCSLSNDALARMSSNRDVGYNPVLSDSIFLETSRYHKLSPSISNLTYKFKDTNTSEFRQIISENPQLTKLTLIYAPQSAIDFVLKRDTDSILERLNILNYSERILDLQVHRKTLNLSVHSSPSMEVFLLSGEDTKSIVNLSVEAENLRVYDCVYDMNALEHLVCIIPKVRVFPDINGRSLKSYSVTSEVQSMWSRWCNFPNLETAKIVSSVEIYQPQCWFDFRRRGGTVFYNDTVLGPLEPIKEDFESFCIEDQEPEFPGGMERFDQYAAQNMVYPEKAKAEKQQGRVYVYVHLEKYGSVSSAEIASGISEELNQEAIRLVMSSEKWGMAKRHGRPVESIDVVVIEFSLTD